MSSARRRERKALLGHGPTPRQEDCGRRLLVGVSSLDAGTFRRQGARLGYTPLAQISVESRSDHPTLLSVAGQRSGRLAAEPSDLIWRLFPVSGPKGARPGSSYGDATEEELARRPLQLGKLAILSGLH